MREAWWLKIGSGWYQVCHIIKVWPDDEDHLYIRTMDGEVAWEEESMESFEHKLRDLMEEIAQ